MDVSVLLFEVGGLDQPLSIADFIFQFWINSLFLVSPYGELKIIVAVFFLLSLLLLPDFSLGPVLLAGLDVVVLDEAVVIVVQAFVGLPHHGQVTRHVGVGQPLLTVLADPVGLLQQRVSVAGQEAVEETKPDDHHHE